MPFIEDNVVPAVPVDVVVVDAHRGKRRDEHVANPALADEVDDPFPLGCGAAAA